MKLPVFLFLFIFFLIGIVSAASSFGYDNPTLPKLNTVAPAAGVSTNYSLVGVNDSLYWNGHAFVADAVSSIESDPKAYNCSLWKSDGSCTATANWNLGIRSLTANTLKTSNVIGNGGGVAALGLGSNIVNTGLLSTIIGYTITNSGQYSTVIGLNYANTISSAIVFGIEAIDLVITSGLADFQDTNIVTTGTITSPSFIGNATGWIGMSSINATQLQNTSGVLNINWTWLSNAGNNIWCALSSNCNLGNITVQSVNRLGINITQTVTTSNLTFDINCTGTNCVSPPQIIFPDTYNFTGANTYFGNVIISGNISVKRTYYYGYDNSTQPNPSAANVNVLNISNNNDYLSYGMSVVNRQNLTFVATGVYICDVSPEFFQNGGSSQFIGFWMQKNGVDVKWSNSRYTMENNDYYAPTIPYAFEIRNPETDNVRFMWYSNSINTIIYSSGALTSPTRPSVPGVIINCRKSSEIT